MKKAAFRQPARFVLPSLALLAVVGLNCNPFDGVKEHYLADLLVRGSVVDADGVPLDRVDVTIETTIMNPGVKSKARKKIRIIDRTFEIHRSSCTSMTAFFCKKGYYCERVRFSTVEDDRVGAVDLVKNDVVVTLYRNLPQVDLMHVGGSISFGSHGVWEVLELPGEVVGNLPIEMGEKYSSNDMPFIYAMAPKDDTKEIFQHQPGSKRSENWFQPRGVRIVLTNPDDGVVPFLFGEEALQGGLVLRRMREAPSEGYQSVVEFEELGNSEFYFYCKIDGLYGRGFAGAPIYSSGNSGPYISVPIQIYLNGNGSRDFTRTKGDGLLAWP